MRTAPEAEPTMNPLLRLVDRMALMDALLALLLVAVPAATAVWWPFTGTEPSAAVIAQASLPAHSGDAGHTDTQAAPRV